MAIPKEVQYLIGKSGNSFHAEVAREMNNKGWRVMVSPYYLDQTLGKAREIDLVVERVWPISNQTDRYGGIAVRLFIECKYVPSYSVFWFSDKDKSSAEDLICYKSPFRKNNIFLEDHHYLAASPRVAKVFASNNNKQAENEPFYKALNQVLHGMVSLQSKTVSAPKPQNSSLVIKHTLDFPVIMCNSFDLLYQTDFDRSSDPIKIEENFQLEVQYAYVKKSGQQMDQYFLLDFVDFGQLDKFLSGIDADVKAASTLAFQSPY